MLSSQKSYPLQMTWMGQSISKILSEIMEENCLEAVQLHGCAICVVPPRLTLVSMLRCHHLEILHRFQIGTRISILHQALQIT